MFWNGEHSQDPRPIPPILERIRKVLPEAGTNFEPSDIPTLMQRLKTHPSRLDTNTSSQLQESLVLAENMGHAFVWERIQQNYWIIHQLQSDIT